MQLHHVVVGRGEHRPGQALPGLGHPGDLGVVLVDDREVPRPPVLGLDHSDVRAAGLQPEPDLAEHVLLDDAADLPAVGQRHDHLRLEQLRRPGQHQLRHTGGVTHLKPVGEELVDRRHEAHGLLQRVLADLDDRADLVPVLVEDGVLVRQLDQLRLLVDDQHRLAEQRTAALRRHVHPGLLADLPLDPVRGVAGLHGRRLVALRAAPAARPRPALRRDLLAGLAVLLLAVLRLAVMRRAMVRRGGLRGRCRLGVVGPRVAVPPSSAGLS
ncbi:hypothetical protein FMEAI12_2910020 [Parafrankia sp. Ea1.12]|nr:hypothetical protein FMEAI12_2910020 [Parafrankia sp. Ea1.12]